MSNISKSFPDYDLKTLPEIPADWEDVSWHHDVCPSWRKGDLIIFIDHIDPSQRECDLPRFVISHVDLFETQLMSDDWQAVLNFVSK